MGTMDSCRAHHSKNECPIHRCKSFECRSNLCSQLRLWYLGPRLECCRNPLFLGCGNSSLFRSPPPRTGPNPFEWRCAASRPENSRSRRPIPPSWPDPLNGWTILRASSPPMCCRRSPATNFPILDPIYFIHIGKKEILIN